MLINIQSYIYDNRCLCLHIVIAQVVGCEHIVVLHVVNHHILAIELLDDDFIIRWVWMHAADSIIRNPYRIVAVFGVNHKIPRARLVLIHHSVNLRADQRRSLVDGFIYEFLLVFPSDIVEPSGKDGVQQDDE